ncbi:MAG: F0F1 ATP synthase subunit delta [Patescibacteria group bacterium]|nr:F0F1 ATP synthase subunit delta [Patescibacteria group bacterium]
MKAKAKQYAQALFLEIKDKSSDEMLVILDNFLNILKRDNCFSQVEKIISYFNIFWQKEYSLVEAEITTARSLDAGLKKEIFDYLIRRSKAEKIKIEEKEDKKIIGGFIVKYGDKIVDASVKNKINLFKNNLIQ